VSNDPVGYVDPSGLKTGTDWYDTWEQWADIRSAQNFWNGVKEESIKNGDWVTATGADIMNSFISNGELDQIQNDGEILGSDASSGEKALAVLDLLRIGASWFYCTTGKEIVPKDPKSFRIAPAGNRAWRRGWEPVRINQAPHYHRRITDPTGKTVPDGGIKWHRPYQKGF
jgi:hypothetical protein